MPRFFLSNPKGEVITLPDELSRHIARSLRMKVGESITLCDGQGRDLICEILNLQPAVTVKVLSNQQNGTEPNVDVRLYQALPKGDKFSFIIQKAVELGVSELIPVLSARCIARPDVKTMEKKLQRYRKIALEAAQQSGRGKVPMVQDMISYREAILQMQTRDENSMVFYECATQPLSSLLKPDAKHFSILIGSEGGFEPSEIKFAEENQIAVASLGKRILRCETAPIAVLSVLMYQTGNFN